MNSKGRSRFASLWLDIIDSSFGSLPSFCSPIPSQCLKEQEQLGMPRHLLQLIVGSVLVSELANYAVKGQKSIDNVTQRVTEMRSAMDQA